MGISVGIDLGTSNSVVAVMTEDGPKVLLDGSRRNLQPSVIALGHGGKPVVGHVARQQLTYAPDTTISSAKRLIGRRYIAEESQRVRAAVAWKVVEGAQGEACIRVMGKTYSVPEVSAHVLSHMVRIAESATGETVDGAVITVPAYFNDQQRQSTRDAAKIAGVHCMRIINEPTAAAMAYGYGEKRDQRVVVYDLGGGTFDISILHIADNLIEVLSTAGDTFLGGDDFDELISTHLRKAHEGSGSTQIPSDHQANMRLLQAAEQIKRTLSTQEQATMTIPGLARGVDGRPIDVEVGLSRSLVRTLCMPLIQRSFVVCDDAMAQAGLSPAQIDAIVLVGGMTRFPVIKEAVGQYFSLDPIDDINPDEVVAVGAALQAANLSTVTDEPGTILLDVTPQTLGLRTIGGFIEPLIPRNTAIPTLSSKVFHTASDNQTEVRIKVYQGDRREARKNFLLGEFILDGLPEGPRGHAKVRVTFAIDADGIVNITAEDVASGSARRMRVEASSKMPEAQIEELKFDREPEPEPDLEPEQEHEQERVPEPDEDARALVGAPGPLDDEDDVALETEEIVDEWAHALPGEGDVPVLPMPDDDVVLDTEEIDLDDDDTDDDVWLEDDQEITDEENSPP